MAVKMDSDRWPELLEELREHLPQSITMYGLLLNHIRGRWSGNEFWVDRFPNFDVLVAKPTPEQDWFVAKFWRVFGSNGDTVKRVLTHIGLPEWTQPMNIELCSSTKDVVAAMIPDRFKLVNTHQGLFWEVTENTLKPVPMIDGVTVDTLNNGDISTLIHNWRHLFTKSECCEYITQLVESEMPHVCLRMSDGSIAAHALTQLHNKIGMLYVDPLYRRKGYGKLCMTKIVELHLKEGEENVALNILHGNQASIGLMSSLGFEPVPGDGFTILYYTL